MTKRKKKFVMTENHCAYCRNFKDECTCPKDGSGQPNVDRYALNVKLLDKKDKK